MFENDLNYGYELLLSTAELARVYEWHARGYGIESRQCHLFYRPKWLGWFHALSLVEKSKVDGFDASRRPSVDAKGVI